MMARIEAGERLERISDGAAAAGNLSQADMERMIARLAAMGIGVVSPPSPASEKPASAATDV